MRVTVPARFNGPPSLGQGGYSCGLAAEQVAADVVAVSLRAPVPLDTPMELTRLDDGTVVIDAGETRIAEATAASLAIDPPRAPSLHDARAATARSPLAPGGEVHPFPTCFGCGPERREDDALRIMPGPLREGDFRLLAAPWTPLSEFADGEGNVTTLFMWAALDCPTGWAAAEPGSDPHVLARLTARPHVAPTRAGEPHVVVAWLIGGEGRKRRGGVAIYDEAAALCALAEGLWIRLREPSTHGALREADQTYNRGGPLPE